MLQLNGIVNAILFSFLTLILLLKRIKLKVIKEYEKVSEIAGAEETKENKTEPHTFIIITATRGGIHWNNDTNNNKHDYMMLSLTVQTYNSYNMLLPHDVIFYSLF